MTTVKNLRKLLDRKQWEPCTPSPTAFTTGQFSVRTPSKWPVKHVLLSQGTNTHYLYDPLEDAYIELVGGILGAHIAGSCGVFHPYGPSGAASAGAANTITTALTLPGDLAGYTIRLTGGTGAGQERVIVRNTQVANSVITVASNWTVNPDATSTYVILSGRFWCLGATGAAVVWKYYDIATNVWVTNSVVAGPPAAWGTDGQVEATSGSLTGPQASGTATAGAAATLSNAAKAWAVNQWANFQVRITGGTGAGQVRTINSNTGTVLTVSAAWTVNPDATSTYVIEGNDDWIYAVGGNAVTMYRYAINGIAGLAANAQATANTWITVAPGVARQSAPGTGMCLRWVSNSVDPRWTDENAIINGRRLHSFRGAGTTEYHYYDIPSNVWVNAPVYSRQNVSFTTGSTWSEAKGIFYVQKEALGRFYKFDVAKNTLDPLSTLLYPQGAAVVGDKTFLLTFVDGETEIDFLYNFRNTGTELFRLMLI